MDFRKTGKGELVNIREEEFTDRKTGEINVFYRVDIVGEIDGVRQCFALTCGKFALNGKAYKAFNPGGKVEFVVMPKDGGGTKLVSLTEIVAAKAAA